MKKYAVVMVFKYSAPSVIFQSDSEENAKKYREVMRDENPESRYELVKLMED